jgi:hypothetical protein
MEKRRASACIRDFTPQQRLCLLGTPTLPILSPPVLYESPTPSRAAATINHHSLALTYATLHCLPHRNSLEANRKAPKQETKQDTRSHLGHSSRTVPNATTVLQRLKPLHNRRTPSGTAPVPGTPGSASWRVSPPDSSRSGAFLRSLSGA